MSGIGQVLRAARRGAGIELGQAARATRLRESYLDALERDEVDSLDLDPAYLRGTVRTYADYLGLDGELLVAVHRADGIGGDNGDGPGRGGGRSVPRRLAGLAGIVAVAAVAFVLGAASARGVPPWARGGLPWAWLGPEAAAPAETPQPTGARDDARAGGGGAEGRDDARAGGGGAGDRDADDQESEAVLASPSVRPLRLRMEFLDQVWVRGVTDGDAVFEGIYEPGQIERIRADEEITLRLGVGGAIEFTLNGVSYGALAEGRSGPIDLRCDSAGGCRVVR